MTGKNELVFRTARYIFLFLLIVLPLTVTTFTHNQSDLPKSFVLITISGLFFILILTAILIFLFAGGKNLNSLNYEFYPLLDIPMLIFIAAASLSTVFSVNPYISFFGEYQRQFGMITFLHMFLLYIFSSFFLSEKKFLSQISASMVFTSVIVSVYAVLQQVDADPFGLQPAGDTRPVSTIGNAVFAGGYLAVIFPIALLNLAGFKNKIIRYIFPVIILSGILVTRTRSAYIAVLIELFVLFAIFVLFKKNYSKNEKKYLHKLLFTLAAVVGFISFIIVLFPENIFVHRFLSIFSGAENQRWLIWRDAFGILGKYPLTGSGIGNFAAAFAEFYSYELRFDDVNRYIDNAHNNYLQILFTMGIIGFASYLLLIGSAVIICLKKMYKSESSDKQTSKINKFHIGLLASMAGYMIYGLSNFDELTITLNLFALLILIKGYSGNLRTIEIRKNNAWKFGSAFTALAIILFIAATSVHSLNILKADIHFLKGEKLFAANKFKEAVSETNLAVIISPENPFYRYNLALNVYSMVLENRSISNNARIDLLTQAANEVMKARKNSPDMNECDALLCLIYYLSGKTNEAKELEKVVFERNSVNIFFRLKLAYYFINVNDTGSARSQLDIVKNFGYKSVVYLLNEALYFYKTGNKEMVITYCKQILELDSKNPQALELLHSVQ